MSYKPGDYLVICDRCGFERFASDCKMTWDGWFVCADTCWEPKYEQFTPPKPLGESQSVPIYRPVNQHNFISSIDDNLEASVTPTNPNDGYFISTPITSDDL